MNGGRPLTVHEPAIGVDDCKLPVVFEPTAMQDVSFGDVNAVPRLQRVDRDPREERTGGIGHRSYAWHCLADRRKQ